jgi:hypothetical protein
MLSGVSRSKPLNNDRTSSSVNPARCAKRISSMRRIASAS